MHLLATLQSLAGRTFTPVLFVFLAAMCLVGFSGTANAQKLAGSYDVTETQVGNSTAYVEVTWDAGTSTYSYTTYTKPGGAVIDQGLIANAPTGGWSWQSSMGGGGGFIQHESGNTYAWQNTQTGTGGTMTKR